MQDITPTLKPGKKQIEAYGNKGFRVAGEKIEGSVIIFPDSVHVINTKNISEINSEMLDIINSNLNEVEILLVGYGLSSDFFTAQVEKDLRSQNISFEYMDTGAAARTYNILLSEERKVAAILIAV